MTSTALAPSRPIPFESCRRAAPYARRDRQRDVYCREVTSERELRECARLRAQVYVWERGWLPASRLHGGLERDDDDDRAIHLLASRNGEESGTARLILRCGGEPLPVESLLDGPLPPLSGAVAEISRLAVAPGARGDSAVLLHLCRGLHAVAVRQGIDDVYAIVEEELYWHLLSLRFPFRRAGAASWTYGSWNFPIVMPVVEAVGGLKPLQRRGISPGRMARAAREAIVNRREAIVNRRGTGISTPLAPELRLTECFTATTGEPERGRTTPARAAGVVRGGSQASP
jgi:N-acyl-L-homoserine lactone synthetase